MGKNKSNNKKANDNVVSTLIKSDFIGCLTEENQKVAIDIVKEVTHKEKEGGLVEKLLGTNKTNVSMHIAFILCIIITIIGLIINDKDIWDKIFTILAATIGYIFGASKKES